MTTVLESVERTHPVPPPVSLPVLSINFIQWAFFGRVWEKPSEDLSGSGKPDDWDVGGVLWVQKRKKEAAAKAAISELRKKKELDEEEGLEQRVGRVEELIQELLVHAEEDRDHREGMHKDSMRAMNRNFNALTGNGGGAHGGSASEAAAGYARRLSGVPADVPGGT